MPAPPAERLTWAAEQLPRDAAGPILEVGCGAGHAVTLLLARCPRAAVTAIDRSAVQVARARTLHAAAIAAGRVRVEALSLETAADALGAHAFAAVLAVNVNAFWTAPAPSLRALARLLARGGRAYLVFEPPGAAQPSALRRRLPALLEAHALRVEEVRETRFRAGHGLCIVGAAAEGDGRGVPAVGP